MNDDNNVSPMLMPVFAAGVIDTKGYKIGSLYKVKDFYWLLFPSNEFISAATSGCTFENLTVAAKVYGKDVSLGYYLMRKPILFLRRSLGI